MMITDCVLKAILWRQQDNSLLLHDNSLDIDFVVILENGTLISLCIPGNFGSIRFKLR